ncbi:DUF2802 domain-containing protein [Vibrio palustris]|uniref:DUF2802 domain-containing protein n=1 Tax=Vibrio palustris TaxID=1918946 RepID=A0A1R4B0G8_9VIBR|nr:DUF2802 domain-containing protein [Vibrio palustris]SJL82401.1 hypothetical protein VPAL9027_00326 [Vibrio palustris]
MMSWSWFTPPVIAGGFVVFSLLFIGGLLQIRRVFHRQQESARQQLRSLDKELNKTSKQLLEVRSVVVGLGQRVSEQKDIIAHLNERLIELEHDDNDGRMYSRASKMVKLGADLDELISECELPKAEAELMMSLQNKLAGKETIPPLTSDPDEEVERRTVSRRPPRKYR